MARVEKKHVSRAALSCALLLFFPFSKTLSAWVLMISLLSNVNQRL